MVPSHLHGLSIGLQKGVLTNKGTSLLLDRESLSGTCAKDSRLVLIEEAQGFKGLSYTFHSLQDIGNKSRGGAASSLSSMADVRTFLFIPLDQATLQARINPGMNSEYCWTSNKYVRPT